MDKVELARELGIFKDGYSFIDYCLEGAPESRWICGIISGEKGWYKSVTLLQHGYSVFHGYDSHDEDGRGAISNWEDMEAWKTALHYICYRPREFALLIGEALKEHRPRSWIGWDDIAIHLSTALYSTDRAKWEVLSKNWAGFRGLLSIFECTAPSKEDVINFIRKDMNFDIELTGRKIVEVYRWFKKSRYDDPMHVNHYRIDIEKKPVNPNLIPSEIWQQYFERTIAIREESAVGMSDTLTEMDKAPEADRENKSMKSCQYCGRSMTPWNLSVHEPACKKKPIEVVVPAH